MDNIERMAKLETEVGYIKEELREVKQEVKTVSNLCSELNALCHKLEESSRTNKELIEEMKQNNGRINWLIASVVLTLIMDALMSLILK